MDIRILPEDVLLMVRFVEVSNHMNSRVSMSVDQTRILLHVIDSFQTTELDYGVDSTCSTVIDSVFYFDIDCQEFIDVVGRSCGDVQIRVEDSRWVVSTTMGSEELSVKRRTQGPVKVLQTSSLPRFTLPATVLFKQAGSACISIAPVCVCIENSELQISTKTEFIAFRSVIPVSIPQCAGPTHFTFKYLKYVIPWMRKGSKVLNTTMDQASWILFIPTKKKDIIITFRGMVTN